VNGASRPSPVARDDDDFTGPLAGKKERATSGPGHGQLVVAGDDPRLRDAGHGGIAA
jgi:hypothetical protein